MTIPVLDRRPTHKALPLLRSEISRLTHRRLFRVLVAILFGAMVLISTVVFFAHSKDVSTNTVRMDAQIQRAEQRWVECAGTQPSEESIEQQCGPNPTTIASDPYEYGNDSRYKAYELLPVALIGAAIAAAGVAFIVGASSGGAEWSSRSMTLQLLFEPRRLRLLCVKWLALLLTTGVVAALAMAVSVGIGAITATMRGTWDSKFALVEQLRDNFGAAMLVTGLRGLALVFVAATIGYAIAMLVRNTGASLGVAFVYFVVFENGVRFALLKYGSEPFMLSSNSIALLFPGGLEMPGKAVGRFDEFTTVQVSNLRAMVTLLVYTAVLALPAAWSFTRRDVS